MLVKFSKHVGNFLPRCACGTAFVCHLRDESPFSACFDASDALQVSELIEHVTYVSSSFLPLLLANFLLYKFDQLLAGVVVIVRCLSALFQ